MPRCSVCGNETERIVLKLYKAPVARRARGRVDANLYSHRADVGTCCMLKINEIDWIERRTRNGSAAA